MVRRVEPLRDNVLLREVETEEMIGRFYIPAQAREMPSLGEVVAVGSGARDEDGLVGPMEVEVGQRVVFHRRGGIRVVVDNRGFVMMPIRHIQGILG